MIQDTIEELASDVSNEEEKKACIKFGNALLRRLVGEFVDSDRGERIDQLYAQIRDKDVEVHKAQTAVNDAISYNLTLQEELNEYRAMFVRLNKLVDPGCVDSADAFCIIMGRNKRYETFLQELSRETEREEYACPGSHRMYSTMAIDTYCPHCGDSEDSLGRSLWRTVPTKLAKRVQELLK